MRRLSRDKLEERAASARLNNATKAAALNGQQQQVNYEKKRREKKKAFQDQGPDPIQDLARVDS